MVPRYCEYVTWKARNVPTPIAAAPPRRDCAEEQQRAQRSEQSDHELEPRLRSRHLDAHGGREAVRPGVERASLAAGHPQLGQPAQHLAQEPVHGRRAFLELLRLAPDLRRQGERHEQGDDAAGQREERERDVVDEENDHDEERCQHGRHARQPGSGEDLAHGVEADDPARQLTDAEATRRRRREAEHAAPRDLADAARPACLEPGLASRLPRTGAVRGRSRPR